MSKTNKTILITGASSGFGRDMAETLAATSHRVFAGIRDANTRNQAAAGALRGKNVNVLQLDVTDDRSVSEAVKELLAKSSKLNQLLLPYSPCFTALRVTFL